MKLNRVVRCRSVEVIIMKIRLSISLTFLLIGLVSFSTLVSSQGTPSPLGIIPTPTPGALTVNVWTDKSVYVVGETLRVYYSVNQSAFIYLYDIQPDGVVRLIFPNAYSQNNFVSAGTHILPDGTYQFLVTPPTGVEQLQIFASLSPLSITPSYYREPFPMVAPDPNAAMNKIQGHIMGITPTPTWATGWTSFTITAPSYIPPSGYPPPPPPYYPPFFGWWFPGGGWYWECGEWHYGMPPSGWYWYFGPDGKWHFRIRIRIGAGDP